VECDSVLNQQSISFTFAPRPPASDTMSCHIMDFISNLTTVMNTRYNATLFILQQEYIQIHMFTNVLLSKEKLCLRKGVNTGVNYNQLYTYTVNKSN